MNIRVEGPCLKQLHLIIIVAILPWVGDVATAAARPNVLFIAVDDLRPELGCYGRSEIVSPNLDRLGSQGVLFRRAYCMVPTCGASRASLLTGVRPARDRFVSYQTWAERDAPDATTLNTHFRNHGYHTVSNGKVFHHAADSAGGWSEPVWRPKGDGRYLQHFANREVTANPSRRGRGPAFESADVSDDFYDDGQVARKAVDDLRRLKGKREPFFLAVGFYKPHLPFVAPRKYWNLYRRENIRLPSNSARPVDAPDAAIHNWGELRSYAGIPAKGPLTDEAARTLIHGYYACVSYTDAQIGRVLDELDRLDLAGNTIVIVWGDHGWNLGEHTLWCKHCCFETSMRAPIIVRVPGVEGGKATDGLTEFIDIYPSLCDLAGLPKPGHLQGTSFVPLLKHPDMPWKSAAIGRFGPGDTIRTDGHRYTAYTTGDGKTQARMLYDHKADSGETVNLAERVADAPIVRELDRRLREGMGKSSR